MYVLQKKLHVQYDPSRGISVAGFLEKYLMGVLRNTWKDSRQRINNHTVVSLDSPNKESGDTLISTIEDRGQIRPDEKAGTEEMARMMMDFIRKQPEAQRKVLTKYFLAQKSYRTVAEELNISESTARKYVCDFRRAAKEKYGHLYRS